MLSNNLHGPTTIHQCRIMEFGTQIGRRYKIFLIISFTWLACSLPLIGRLPTKQIFADRGPLSFQRSNAYHRPLFNNEKWIVVTSISSPTEQIQKLVKLQGWAVLVIADLKTPKNWTYPGAIFLSTEAQAQLGYEIFDHIPWNSYTRKMIGYLFAIEHGAKIIYDTDDDNCPDSFMEFEENFVFSKESKMGGLVVLRESSSSPLKNPYPHFGQESIWPRGYPLQWIGDNDNNTYTVCKVQVPSIQQGLVNGDPDVDAIFRLTRKKMYQPINVTFDPAAPPLIYSKGVLAPFNSQNTIFLYDAFWAMMLPISVAFRVTDIWRGYWAQPLLWIVGEHLGFFTAHTTQIRNTHNYLKDFAEEKQLYEQSGSLVKFLVSWKCKSEDSNMTHSKLDFGKCIVQLTEDMAGLEYWSKDEVALAKAWVNDLNRIGYKMPIVKPNIKENNPCPQSGIPTHVVFNPAQPDADPERYKLKDVCDFVGHPHNDVISNTTMNDANNTIMRSPEKVITSFFPKTLLVITFNHPHYDNIWLLDLIYRPHFPNILYCGDFTNTSILTNLYSREEWRRAGVSKISLIHAEMFSGFFAYECGLRAIEMNYGVEDYIVLSDDVLFKFWEVGDYPATDAWGIHVFAKHLLNADSNDSVPSWQWWNSPWGKNVTGKSLGTIYGEAQNGNKHFQEFVTNREMYGFNISTTSYFLGDFFHFSKNQAELFYEAGWIFLNNKVFLEIAVPNLLFGISQPTTELRSIPGSSIWSPQREDPFANFVDYGNGIVFHPVKLGVMLKNEKLRTDYCLHYVANLLRVGER